MAVDVSDSEVYLLLLPREKKIFAVSSLALSRAQATKEELRSYRDALLINRRGNIKVIKQVDILGAFGQTWMRRILSYLTGAWLVRVHLIPPPFGIDLTLLKRMIAESIALHGGVQGPDADESRQVLISEVERAINVAELFQALRMPQPEDALDVL